MSNGNPVSRRVFLAKTGGLILTLGSSHAVLAARRPAGPYSSGLWIAGDHHIHTKYSPDGQYQIEQQVANAARYGLGWCVITDHGGPHHDRVALEQAYPDLVAARAKYPQVMVFQGMEWNIPNAEHGSVIMPPTADEARRVAEFERRFDEKNISEGKPHTAEEDAISGIRYLQSLEPKPLFMANHPARRGLDSPHEMRAWSDAGPDVARGFEGAPGHQAGTLIGGRRGEYDKKPDPATAFAGYPEESYRTWGGYDWYVANVGGLWDSLLGEGRAWYITADSDSHRHWDDRAVLDTSTYLTKGYVTDTGKTTDKSSEPDFFPGEYAKTWVYARERSHLAVLDALRSGSMFTVLGGLVDRLEFSAAAANHFARMGGDLLLERNGDHVEVTVKVRPASGPNGGGTRPALHHLDLIAGDITGPVADRDRLANPTTRVVRTWQAREARRQGDLLVFTHRFERADGSFYLRLRGTNTEVGSPRMDSLTVNPWQDLWFYSNPIFVRLAGR